MIPLIDEAFHDNLSTLRQDMGAFSPAQVFVPVGGESPDLRVLFVGKATMGWAEAPLASFHQAAARSEALVREHVQANYFRGFIRTITKDAAQALGMSTKDEKLHEHMGWTNLAKIGATEDNPSARSLNLQKALCIESLLFEVELFRPAAIIFATSDFASQKILEPFVDQTAPGRWQHHDPEGRIAVYKRHNDGNPAIVWANHPQSMGRERRVGIEELAVRLIVDAVEG